MVPMRMCCGTAFGGRPAAVFAVGAWALSLVLVLKRFRCPWKGPEGEAAAEEAGSVAETGP